MARNDAADVRSLRLFDGGNPIRAAAKYRREEVRDIPPIVTTMNQSGIVAMITLLRGCWCGSWWRRVALRTSDWRDKARTRKRAGAVAYPRNRLAILSPELP